MDRMDDLIAFLRARLDEDQETAAAASWSHGNPGKDFSAHWAVASSPYGGEHGRPRWYVTDAYDDCVIGKVDPEGNDDEGVARHVARFDPERMLAEVDAKRKIIDNYVMTLKLRDEAAARLKDAGDHPGASDLDTWTRAKYEAVVLEEPIALLALPYADHTDYRDEWRP